MDVKDGGPAFGHGAENGHCCGMTVRDYFAAHALTGPVQYDYMCAVKDGYGMSCEQLALLAYQLADAMLNAREQK